MNVKAVHYKAENYDWPRYHFDHRLRGEKVSEQLTLDKSKVTCTRCLNAMAREGVK